MAGTAVTKAGMDEQIGRTLKALNLAFRDVEALKFWIDTHVDGDLANLGWDPGEIANMRSAITDVDDLRKIYEGGALPGAPRDFRAFARRLWGMGF